MGHFTLVFLLAALATSVLAEPVPQPWKPIETATPIECRQEALDDCNFFEAPASPQEDYAYFAARWGISVQDFINWVLTLSPRLYCLFAFLHQIFS